MLSNGDSPAGPDMLSPRLSKSMPCRMNGGLPSVHTKKDCPISCISAGKPTESSTKW